MHDKRFHLILLGPPGSGKGTQAVTLSKTLNIPHISTGDLFRHNIKLNTPLGQQAKIFIDQGLLTPDELVLDMLFERLYHADCKKGFLLDGFPRTIAQAEIFERHYPDLEDLIVLNLAVSDEIIVKRIEGRQVCRGCGKVYNKYFSPSTVMDRCDSCQAELYQRPDDRSEIVQERLKAYHAQSRPLIAHYQQKGILRNIDGEASPSKVQQELIDNICKST